MHLVIAALTIRGITTGEHARAWSQIGSESGHSLSMLENRIPFNKQRKYGSDSIGLSNPVNIEIDTSPHQYNAARMLPYRESRPTHMKNRRHLIMKQSSRVWLVGVMLFVAICCETLYMGRAAAQGTSLTWEFDAPVDSIVAHDTLFAVLADGEIWMCNPVSNGSKVPLQLDADIPIQQLFTDNAGNLSALSVSDTAYDIYSINVDEPSISLAYKITSDNAPREDINQVLWQDGQIIIEFGSDAPRTSDILYYDTASGETKSDDGCDTTNLTPYSDRMLLGLQQRYDEGLSYAVVTLDMDSKEISKVCSAAEFPEAIGFDPKENLIITFTTPNANIFSTSGAPQKQCYIPVAYDAYSGRHCAVNKNRLFAISDGNRLLVIDLDAEQSTSGLQITRFNEDGPETKRFRLSHGEIPVRSIDMGYQLTPAMISQQIRGNDQATDIYMARTFEVGYTELLDKGFCTDLSDNADIWSSVMRMQSSLSSALMRDGRLFGVPVDLEFESWTALACSPETLEDVGIDQRELPTNMLDLLDKLLTWYVDGTLSGVRLFDYAASDQAYTLTWYVLSNYTYYESAESDGVDYDTSLFRALLQKCDDLCAKLKEQSELTDASPFLFEYANPADLLPDGENDESIFLPMVPQAGMAQRYPAYMTVATLNPLSQNKALSFIYLSALLEELPSQTKLLFWPELAQPEERSGYQKDSRMAMDEMDRLSSLLNGDRLAATEKSEIQSQLNDTEQWLAYLQKDGRWELSPETINVYRTIENCVYIPSSAVAEMLDEQTSDTVRQYTAGKIDSTTFIETTIRKARLIQQERGNGE